MQKKIEVIPYNPRWLDIYKQEADKIANVLKEHLKAIHFIGSTAIPGMPAKPIIDILIELENIDYIQMVAEQLSTIGFQALRRQIIPYRSFFSTRNEQENQRIHLHIYEQGDPQVARHVNFRDYLIHHPLDAQAYADLKAQLAQTFQYDISQYVLGKEKLVQTIDLKAKKWAAEYQKQTFLPQNPGKPLKYWSQKQIIHAMEANFNVYMTHFAQFLNQVEFIRKPGFTLVHSGLADDTLNYVLDADFSESLANEKISEASAYFTKRNMPFSWWISPHDQPVNLMYELEKHSYQHSNNKIAVSFDLDSQEISSIKTELNIVRACDHNTLQDFAQISASEHPAFKEYYSWIASLLTENDPIEYYVGYIKGKPVVRSASCYYAGVCGLYGLFTAVEARKQGYGSIMRQAQLKQAKTRGYHVAVLQIPEEKERFFHQLGYKRHSIFRKFKCGGLT